VNHLAHFHLAGESEALIVGALLGDYVKGRLCGELPIAIEHGVRLHRLIDAFTDSHPAVHALRALFVAGERRLAGIVTDMFFDHFLVLHWARFHPLALRRFSERVHDILDAHEAVLPPAGRVYAGRMRKYDLLCGYRDVQRIDGALRHIGVRLGRERLMRAATQRAWDELPRFEAAFLAFYPEAIAKAVDCRRIAPHAQDCGKTYAAQR
jgi:acyl carrier protein phosphodiesterase